VQKFLDYIVQVVQRDIDEIKKKGIYRKGLNPEVTAIMLIGAVMFMVYQFDRLDKDIMDKEIINAVVSNYLAGVSK